MLVLLQYKENLKERFLVTKYGAGRVEHMSRSPTRKCIMLLLLMLLRLLLSPVIEFGVAGAHGTTKEGHNHHGALCLWKIRYLSSGYRGVVEVG